MTAQSADDFNDRGVQTSLTQMELSLLLEFLSVWLLLFVVFFSFEQQQKKKKGKKLQFSQLAYFDCIFAAYVFFSPTLKTDQHCLSQINIHNLKINQTGAENAIFLVCVDVNINKMLVILYCVHEYFMLYNAVLCIMGGF